MPTLAVAPRRSKRNLEKTIVQCDVKKQRIMFKGKKLTAQENRKPTIDLKLLMDDTKTSNDISMKTERTIDVRQTFILPESIKSANTPRKLDPTPYVPSNLHCCLTLATQCLAALDLSSAPEFISSRSSQFERIFNFFATNLTAHTSDALYIAGSPGTGKSLCVDRVMNSIRTQYSKQFCPIMTSMNAMSLRESKQFSSKLLSNLFSAFDHRNSTNETFTQEVHNLCLEEVWELLKVIVAPSNVDADEKIIAKILANRPCLRTQFQNIQSNNRMVVIAIDEVDTLLTHSQFLLKQLLSISALSSSRLLLVMISNCIGVSDKVEPEWKPSGAKFFTLIFPIYSQNDLQSIVKERLLHALQVYLESKVLSHGDTNKASLLECAEKRLPIFDSFALHLCCMKVASRSGDARTVLDLCRQGISALISQIRTTTSVTTLHESINSADLDLFSVSTRHMSKLLNSAFNSSLETIAGLTDQQKLILLTLASEKVLNDRDPSSSQFFAIYRERARYFRFPHIAEREVRDILGYLESLGLIVLKKEKGTEKGGHRASRGNARLGSSLALDNKCLSLAIQVGDLRFGLTDPFWMDRWRMFDQLVAPATI